MSSAIWSTRVMLLAVVAIAGASPTGAADPPPEPPKAARGDLLNAVLPAGDYRNLRVRVIELAPGAGAPRHRHDVAVVAYVLEGTVENQFDDGELLVHRTGESWWERPGTVHGVARNASTTSPARLLLVFIGEEGKVATVLLE